MKKENFNESRINILLGQEIEENNEIRMSLEKDSNKKYETSLKKTISK